MGEVSIKRIQKTTAVQKALQNLRAFIRTTEKNVLPNEDELASLLGVSRLTVREAITVLESEGLVSRIQGKGTQINLFATKLQNRIDIGSDIEGCLRDNGYDVRFDVIDMYEKEPDDLELINLNLETNDKLLVVEKLLYANEEVVAVYTDRIPLKYIKRESFDRSDFLPSIFQVVEEFCQMDIAHDVVQIAPCLTDEILAKYFGVEVKVPLIKCDVLQYTAESVALMYNTEYYTDRFINFTICRSVNYKDK